jgi:hypothetical protein
MESWCLGMLKECLVYSSMRLGVPFIAPRQLGAVESNLGRLSLPSVGWCIGQSGAPSDTVRCWFLSYSSATDRWRFGAVGAPDSPVPPSDRWLGHASRADCAADHWLGRPLAHRTVRCTTGQSGDLYPYAAVETREQAVYQTPAWRTGHCPVHHRTVRCTQTEQSLGCSSQVFSICLFYDSST